MADDIVTRLRDEIDNSVKADPQVLRDAADEIERLRAVNSSLQRQLLDLAVVNAYLDKGD